MGLIVLTGTGWGVYVKKPQCLCQVYDSGSVITRFSDFILDGLQEYIRCCSNKLSLVTKNGNQSKTILKLEICHKLFFYRIQCMSFFDVLKALVKISHFCVELL